MGLPKTGLSSSATGASSSPLSSQTRAGVGASSDVKSAPPPDPRWPYLNRWSGDQSLAVLIGEIESSAIKSPAIPPREAITPVEIPAAVLDPTPVAMLSLEEEASALKPAMDSVASPPSQGSLEEEAPALEPSTGTVAPPSIAMSPEDEATALKTNPSKETVDPPMRQGLLPQRSLGAWNKKLNLSSAPLTHKPPARSTVDQRMWPTLGASKLTRRETQVSQKPVMEMEDPIRFPWAARMNPASRNLYRANEPEYLEDGTPKVTIPSHVFLQGLENQKEYVLGQFFRCSLPPGGLVYAVLNNLWGRDCKITIRKLGDSSYLFHIPNESTRTWVLQRGLWHVDDCLMFIAPWTPGPSLAIPEIKTIPMWVTLKKIPNVLYSIPGISHIASGLGAPIKTHKPRLDPILMGEAKILVEVELNKAFPPRIAASNDSGFISMVDVEYAWLPSTCGRCGQLGHKVKRCLQAGSDSGVVDHTTTKAPVIDDTVVCNEVTEPQVDSVTVNVIEGSPSGPVTTDSLPATIVTVPNLVIPTPTSEKVTMCTPQAISQAATTNEKVIESPISGTARPLSATKDTIAQEHSSFHLGRERSIGPDFGSNKFASLVSLEEDADSSESDKELDETDHMTPFGKRILRDRPVKPSTKAKEMHWQSTARGRGNRGRGSRG